MNTPVRLLQFSDMHLEASAQAALRGVATLASLRGVLAAAAGRRSHVDALLCTGDLVNDDAGGYAHFVREFSSFNKPVYCIPGNHDDPLQLRRSLSQPPFQVGGHADLGPWRIVLVDSCVPGQAGGRISAAELAALDAALASSHGFALVCVHHHPVPMASRWLDAVGIENADEFWRVLDAHAQVRVVSWGHVHQCYDGRRQGVRLLATPSTCVQFLPLSDQFAVDGRPPAYRRLTLQPDGTVDTEVVWVDAQAQSHSSASRSAF
jgi:Icc protein